MKKYLILLLMTVSMASYSREIVFILPEKITPNFSEEIKKNIVNLTQHFQAADAISVMALSNNNQNLKKIARLSIPDDERWSNNVKLIQKLLHKQLYPKIGLYFKDVASEDSNGPDGIYLPTILHRLTDTDEIFLFGAPIARQVDLSIGYPSDAFITTDLELSEFGRIQTQKQINRIFWILPSSLAFKSEWHRQQLKRFFFFYAKENKSTICGFTDDIQRALECELNEGAMEKLNVNADKLEFLIASPLTKVGSENWLTTSNVERLPLGQTTVKNLQLGLTWTGECDLDLYAQTGDKMEEVFYGRPKSSLGYLVKDLLASPGNNGFETVIFEGPVDIKKLVIHVNVYSCNEIQNTASTIKFSVRALIDGRVYSLQQAIPFTRGNRGSVNTDGTRVAPYWMKISQQQLFSLTQ